MSSFRYAQRTTMLLSLTAVLAGCAGGVSLDEPIESRTWHLQTLGQQPVAPGTEAQRDPQLVFDGARMSGSGGCNRIASNYQRQGGQLQFGPINVTRMACADAERNTLETGFLAALRSTTGYRVIGTELRLLDASGQTLATLVAAR